MDESPTYPHIPYGQGDFRRIRLNRWLYVDKTRFLRRLEQEHYVFLIRPRRFGKTLWVSLLENYYDRWWGHEFDAVFAGTDIGANPTPERHRYVVLRFDFSAVDDKLETLEREFETYCLIELRGALERYPDLFPESVLQRILSPPSIATKLAELFRYASSHDIPLYVLIDEYDNFANTVLASHGAEAYRDFTHGGGFYRNFFATLKSGTARSGGGIDRLFITGVSPVTMDDVTSGFNIGTNISLHPDFNEMVGFTRGEVRRLVETYREHGVLAQDVDTAMGIMGQWYNGYRFAKAAETDLYNTDMVLYYLKDSIPNRGVPDSLIDSNVRIDYGKLRHLLVVGRQTGGNFDLLRSIIGEEQVGRHAHPGELPAGAARRRGELPVAAALLRAAEHRRRGGRHAAFGDPQPDREAVDVRLPARRLPGREGVQNQHVPVRAVDGADGQQGRVAAGVRVPERGDLTADGNPRLHRRREGGGAPCRGFRVPGGVPERDRLLRVPVGGGAGEGARRHRPGATARFPHLRVGYLIELKYLARSGPAHETRVVAAVGEATAQLRRYLADERLARQFPGVRFAGLAVVFHGWEMVFCDAVA